MNHYNDIVGVIRPAMQFYVLGRIHDLLYNRRYDDRR